MSAGGGRAASGDGFAPLLRLQLVVDADLGPALWVREQTAPRRSRAVDDLSDLLAQAPEALATALGYTTGERTRLRHRVRLIGRDGEDARRVPALPLDGAGLLAMVAASRGLLEARFGDRMLEQVSDLLEQERAVMLGAGVAAMPDLLAACVLDLRAEQVVAERQLQVEVVEEPDGPHLRWRPLENEGPEPMGALVDARARAAFAAQVGGAEPAGSGSAAATAASSSAAPATPGDSARDPVLAALTTDAPLAVDLPEQRRIVRAFDAMLRTGCTGVKLAEADAELVVRLHEPPLGTAWPLQTCLRESDGTVHPVADLRAVGDVTAAGAAEASAAVLRLAPTVRGAAVDDTGVDWLLTTAEASVFLTQDTPALEAAGMTVLLPRDWTKQRTTLRPQAEQEDGSADGRKRAPGAGLAAMASFRWKVAVGDVELTDEEIDEIREAQSELVKLRGQWVRLDASTLRAAEKFLDAFTARTRVSRRAAAEPGVPAPTDASGPHAPATTVHATTRPDAASRSQKSAVGRDKSTISPGRSGVSRSGSTVDAGRGPDQGRGTPPGAPAESAFDVDPHLQPAPALVSGEMTWAQLFSRLLSDDADGLAVDPGELGANALGTSAAAPLLRLMPGGPGAEPAPHPSALRATLRPYQQAGLDWMWTLHRLRLGGILADDMGLGKTMQVLALLCRERELGADGTVATRASVEGASSAATCAATTPSAGPSAESGPAPASVGPTLLVCPMSVVGAWQREAARWAPHLSVTVHHGGDRIRDESFAPGAADTDLVLTTYSLLARDLRILSAVDWHRVVFDEAQHLKNPGTQVTRAARALPAMHRLALTGTPVENRLADLHALMEAVNPGMLGAASAFRERIATPIEQDGDPGALARLKLVTSPFILRRVKTDRTIIADLPEKTELRRIVNLTPEQAGLYEAIVDELMVQIDGADEKQRRTLVVSALTRLKQVCNHPAHYLGDGSALLRGGEHRSGKLELVDDLLGEVFEAGRKALVFTQFTAFGHLLVPHWRERFGIEVPFLHGGLAKRDRDAMVERFQGTPDEPGVMLLSLRAGGTGLTLTAASEVVHVDRWWNPAVENQATDRAFRIGQRRDVAVHKLVSAGTVEEKIDDVLTRKQELAELTIAPGEDWLADLDDAGLRDLLTLTEPTA